MSSPNPPTPREASSAGASAARTGLVTALVTPLVFYRLAPWVVWALGVPDDMTRAQVEVLSPLLAGGLVATLAALGTALRNAVHDAAQQGGSSGAVAKFLANVLP